MSQPRKIRRQSDKELQEQLTQLRAALVTYGLHVTGCMKWGSALNNCTCGLDAAKEL